MFEKETIERRVATGFSILVFFLVIGTSLAFEPALNLNTPNSVYVNQRSNFAVLIENHKNMNSPSTP